MLEMFIHKIWNIWTAGGWVMIPLLVLSLLIYGLAAQMWLYFSKRSFTKVSEDEWRGWVRDPSLGRGEVGEIIRYCQDGVTRPDDIHCRFAEVMISKIPPIDRRLSTLNTLIAAAPLLGLLGTVFGMLVTFQALATGGGKATDMMAAGISQALFPPEVGLCIALPGLMLVHMIKRKRLEYEAFLAHLESYTIQFYKKNFGQKIGDDQTVFIRKPGVNPAVAKTPAVRPPVPARQPIPVPA